MTLPSYATRGDVIRFGLPAAALVASSRSLTSVDAAGNALMLEGHGLSDGDALTFVADTLPAPLAASTVYYALVISPDLLRVSLTPSGAPVDITTTGAAPITVRVSNEDKITAALEERSRTVEAALAAHKKPFAQPYPSRVVAWVARLAAADLVVSLGLANSNYRDSVQPILDAAKFVWAELSPYRGGLPLDELSVIDATPATADNSAIGWGDDARGWDAHAADGGSCL